MGMLPMSFEPITMSSILVRTVVPKGLKHPL